VAADPGDLVQAVHHRQGGGQDLAGLGVDPHGGARHRPSRPAGIVDGCAGATSWWLGGGDLGDGLLDLGGELVDLAAEGVDLVQQYPRQLCVMVAELAGEGLHQRRVLDTQPPSGQLGERLGVTLTCDQRLDHGPARHPEDVGGHRPQLDQGVLQQLLQPLLVPGALGGQVGAQPGVVPQLADLGGRHERGS
jgi:hypothetical protein